MRTIYTIATVACLAAAAPARAETALEFAASGMGRAIVEHVQPVRHGRHARQAGPIDIRYRVSARRGGGHVEIVASVDGGRVTTINGNKGRNRVGWSHRTVAGAAYYRPIRIASM